MEHITELSNLMFDIKDKMTNDEYLTIMNQVQKIYECYKHDDYYDDDEFYNGDDYNDGSNNDPDYSSDTEEDFDRYQRSQWNRIHYLIRSKYQCTCTENKMQCAITNIACIHYKQFCSTVPGIQVFLSRNNSLRRRDLDAILLSVDVDYNVDSSKRRRNLLKFTHPLLNYVSDIFNQKDKAILVLIIVNFAIRNLYTADDALRFVPVVQAKITELREKLLALLEVNCKTVINEDKHLVSLKLDIWQEICDEVIYPESSIRHLFSYGLLV